MRLPSLPKELAFLSFALGSFHTAVFLAVLVTILHLTDGLREALDDLNTTLGLLLFAALWIATWLGTALALESILRRDGRTDAVSRWFLRDGIIGGGWAGAWFAIVLVAGVSVIVIGASIVEGHLIAPFFLVGFTVVALLVGFNVGFLVGAFFGVCFALIDALVFMATNSIVSSDPTRLGGSFRFGVAQPGETGEAAPPAE
jgi:hypothetical protein